QTLEALRALLLEDAALQRDVLRARAGLLRNYDPLVRSVAGLRGAAATLAGLRESEMGESSTEIAGQIDALTDAIGEQESLVESFKSSNALLQNSLNYFNHSGHAIGQRADDAGLAAANGGLANSMQRFIGDPSPDAAAELSAALDRLDRLAVAPDVQPEVKALVAHGRLIVATLPAGGGLPRPPLAAPTAGRTRLVPGPSLPAPR